MVAETNFKINLGLHIIDKLPNGFHSIETAFYPVYNQRDTVEINHSDQFEFKMIGGDFILDMEQNLCVKAYRIMEKKYNLPPISLTLNKNIPSGAGIGGGSGDAATTLLLINQYFDLKLPEDQLCLLAKQLGSDVPFFIINKPCFATGVGDLLTPISLDLSSFYIELIFSNVHISTQNAYSWIKPHKPTREILDILQMPIKLWKQELVNDFEKVIFPKYPELEKNKQTLYDKGALYASMSGSGSSVYGIFPR